MSPPPMLMTSSGVMAKVRPYEGEDASTIISSVMNRTRSRSNAAGGQATPAYSVGGGGGGSGAGSDTDGAERPAATSPPVARSAAQAAGQNTFTASGAARGHRRNPSGSNPSTLPPKPLAAALYDAANGGPSPAHHLANAMANDQRNSNGSSSGSERLSPLPARPSSQLQA